MGLLSGARRVALGALRRPWSPSPFSSTSRSSNQKVAGVGDQNIILMGPPGAGKTSVGAVVARRLGLPAIDVDDDVLEPAWGRPVAARLAELGAERFLEEEGRAVCAFHAARSVVSLSGSNPLHAGAMEHLRRAGLVVYLDVAAGDILARLSRMKVDRIVGQEAGASMRDILEYRRAFYERWLDVRVLCGTGDTVEEVAEKVLRAVERYQNPESDTFISTRSPGNGPTENPTYFSDVVVEGLAPDGGLYVPRNGVPKLDAKEWLRLVDMSYPERALAILEKCIHPADIPAAELRTMVFEAYGANFASRAVAPVKHLVDNQYVQELFHGPTASFKDLALQLFPRLFARCLPPGCNYLVLAATSGDTGGAVLSGFGALGGAGGGGRRTAVLVFFPEEGVSRVQKLQMTGRGGGNARAAGVLADFDFCQRSMKRMFGDGGVTGHLAAEYGTVLSTANSINWARLLPQVVYHSSAYLDLFRDGVIKFGDPIDVCIPTGNFGNAMSALYARQMGVPIRTVICASNSNRAVADFLTTGELDLRGRPLLATRSPAIDILKSSNLERFVHHVSGGDGRLVAELFGRLERDGRLALPGALLSRAREHVVAGWCSEDECLAAIRAVHRRTGYVMDTHTAVAQATATRLQDRRCPVVVCSTAHYAKFAPAVVEALGFRDVPDASLEQLRAVAAAAAAGPEMHEGVMACLREDGGRTHTLCPAEYTALVDQVEAMIQDSFLKVL